MQDAPQEGKRQGGRGVANVCSSCRKLMCFIISFVSLDNDPMTVERQDSVSHFTHTATVVTHIILECTFEHVRTSVGSLSTQTPTYSIYASDFLPMASLLTLCTLTLIASATALKPTLSACVSTSCCPHSLA